MKKKNRSDYFKVIYTRLLEKEDRRKRLRLNNKKKGHKNDN